MRSHLKFHDSFGLEADCLLTAIVYHRTKEAPIKKSILWARIDFLENKILNKGKKF